MNKRWNWKALVFSVDPSFTTIAHLLFEDRLSVLCFCIQVRLFYLTIAGATSQSDDIFFFFKVYLLLQRRISSNSVMIWLISWKRVKLWFPFSVGSTVRGLAQLNLQIKLKTNKNRNHPLSFLVVDMLCYYFNHYCLKYILYIKLLVESIISIKKQNV